MRWFPLLIACCTTFAAYSRSPNTELDTICAAMDTPRYQEYVTLSCACTVLTAAEKLSVTPPRSSDRQLLLLLLQNSAPTLFINASLATRKKLLQAILNFEKALLSQPKSLNTIKNKRENRQQVEEALDALKHELNAYTTATYGIPIEQAPQNVRILQDQLKRTNPRNS